MKHRWEKNTIFGFVSFKNNVFSLEPMCIKLAHTNYFIVCAFF